MKFIYVFSLVYRQLLIVGVHIGHSFKNSIAFSGWLVYTYKQNLLIINLFKTLLVLKNGYISLSSCVRYGVPIWFISLDRAFSLYVTYFAKICGEFGYSTYWIHGMLSNWLTLGKTLWRLNRRTAGSARGKFFRLDFSSSSWSLTRWSWPRTCHLPSAWSSAHPSKECSDGGMGCIGIVDTNISGHVTNMATPGNDDSLDCIVLYTSHISKYILEHKFRHIVNWFSSVKKDKRLTTFKDWLLMFFMRIGGFININKAIKLKRFVLDEMRILKRDINLNVNPFSNFLGSKYYCSKNNKLKEVIEQVNIYSLNDNIYTTDRIKLFYDLFILYVKSKLVYYTHLFNFSYANASWFNYKIIRKKNLSDKKFATFFLTGNYYVPYDKNQFHVNFYIKKFTRNKFYKTLLIKKRLRFNNMVLKFVKLFYLTKYAYNRGFFYKDTSIFLRNGTLYYSYLYQTSFFYKKKLFTPLMKSSKKFLNKFKNKKVSGFFVENLKKRRLNFFIRKIINKLCLKKLVKFFFLYKFFVYVKKIVRCRAKIALQTSFFYFNFWWFNNADDRSYRKVPKHMFLSQAWYYLYNIAHKWHFFKIIMQSIYHYHMSKNIWKSSIKNFYIFFDILKNNVNNNIENLNKKIYYGKFLNYVNIYYKVFNNIIYIKDFLYKRLCVYLSSHRYWYWRFKKDLKFKFRERRLLYLLGVQRYFSNRELNNVTKAKNWKYYCKHPSIGKLKFFSNNKLLLRLSYHNNNYNRYNLSLFYKNLGADIKFSIFLDKFKYLFNIYKFYYTMKNNKNMLNAYSEDYDLYKFNRFTIFYKDFIRYNLIKEKILNLYYSLRSFESEHMLPRKRKDKIITGLSKSIFMFWNSRDIDSFNLKKIDSLYLKSSKFEEINHIHYRRFWPAYKKDKTFIITTYSIQRYIRRLYLWRKYFLTNKNKLFNFRLSKIYFNKSFLYLFFISELELNIFNSKLCNLKNYVYYNYFYKKLLLFIKLCNNLKIKKFSKVNLNLRLCLIYLYKLFLFYYKEFVYLRKSRKIIGIQRRISTNIISYNL